MVRRKLDKDTINKDLESRGIELVGEYTSSSSKTTFKCSMGHLWETTTSNVRNHGSGYPYCSGKAKLNKLQINKILEPRGLKLVGDYTNNATKTLFECSFGHTWEAKTTNVLGGDTGCPECNSTWKSSGFIYIMESSMGTKIGISNSPKRRREEIIRESNILDLNIFGCYTIGTGSKIESYKMEKEAHEYFFNSKLEYTGFSGCTEFFDVPAEVAEKFLLDNGCVKAEK